MLTWPTHDDLLFFAIPSTRTVQRNAWPAIPTLLPTYSTLQDTELLHRYLVFGLVRQTDQSNNFSKWPVIYLTFLLPLTWSFISSTNTRTNNSESRAWHICWQIKKRTDAITKIYWYGFECFPNNWAGKTITIRLPLRSYPNDLHAGMVRKRVSTHTKDHGEQRNTTQNNFKACLWRGWTNS